MRISNLFAVIIATMVHATAGEPLTFLRHNAVGWGTAQVFDGGPTVSDSGGTEDSDDSSMSFLAVDFTPGGSFGAAASAGGRSRITNFEQSMTIVVDLSVGYSPSVFPGGDNPGGMAEGGIDSVIEFVMPVDELEWDYGLTIDQRNSSAMCNVKPRPAIALRQGAVFSPLAKGGYWGVSTGVALRFTERTSPGPSFVRRGGRGILSHPRDPSSVCRHSTLHMAEFLLTNNRHFKGFRKLSSRI